MPDRRLLSATRLRPFDYIISLNSSIIPAICLLQTKETSFGRLRFRPVCPRDELDYLSSMQVHYSIAFPSVTRKWSRLGLHFLIDVDSLRLSDHRGQRVREPGSELPAHGQQSLHRNPHTAQIKLSFILLVEYIARKNVRI